MRLVSDDGTSVDLQPLRFQFGSSSKAGDWDANWLYIGGQVELPDGRSWSFSDPCLTTWEARTLESWLRQVVAGAVHPVGNGDPLEEQLLVFTEPNLAFSLARRDDGTATLRVHLSLEALPPWLWRNANGEQPEIFDFFVEVQLALPALAAAADSWLRELEAFPVR